MWIENFFAGLTRRNHRRRAPVAAQERGGAREEASRHQAPQVPNIT